MASALTQLQKNLNSASTPIGRSIELGISALIIANIFCVVFETVPGLASTTQTFLSAFETFSVFLFTIEFGLRLWAAPINPRYAGPNGRLNFLFSPLSLIDLISIAPSLLPFLGFDLRALRALRLFRLLRVFKLARYQHALGVLTRVLLSKAPQLIISGIFASIVLLLASGVMYHIEHDAQPDKFDSIPSAMWWAIATLTTVGYGDVMPITPFGKFFGSFVAVMGIGLFALPAGILASGFSEAIQESKNSQSVCPSCREQFQRLTIVEKK